MFCKFNRLNNIKFVISRLRMALLLLCDLQFLVRRFIFVVYYLFKNAVKCALALTVSEINRFLVFTILPVIILFCSATHYMQCILCTQRALRVARLKCFIKVDQMYPNRSKVVIEPKSARIERD